MYENDPIYKIMAEFADRAGIEIFYQELHKHLQPRLIDRAIMPAQNVFATPEDACIKLGYEIGRIVSGNIGKDPDADKEKAADTEAWLFGLNLYRMASMINARDCEALQDPF